MLCGGVVARVLNDSLAHAKRQIESPMRSISLFKVLADP